MWEETESIPLSHFRVGLTWEVFGLFSDLTLTAWVMQQLLYLHAPGSAQINLGYGAHGYHAISSALSHLIT